MIKILAIVMMLIALVGGAYYYSNSQDKKTSVNPTVDQQANQVATTSGKTLLVTTDESIDSDMSALDKDLSSLQQSDTTLTSEVNGL